MWRTINFIYQFGAVELLLVCLLIMNVVTLMLYWTDKRRAVKGRFRISEGTLLFFTLFFGALGASIGIYGLRHKTKKAKFRISVALGLVILAIPVVHAAHSLTLDRVIRFVELDFVSTAWPADLDGYRIAFMSDMHDITDEDMAAVATELNDRDLDLLLLGGDFADFSRTAPHYRGTVRELALTVTSDGIFGVEGNHDNYASLFAAMVYYGITPLDNTGLLIQEGFYLAGVQDMWNRSPNVADAISGAGADDFVVLVSHNPDVTMAQSTEGIDFILSGHTHGGQITFFGYPFYLLLGGITDYGTRFARGFNYSADGVPVFASNGVGVYYNWPRIFARPEVVIFTMYNE
ncbi:MAG: DUF1294 domain-containing protein [Turicibacter sp.]|nr:DUF1294 domain-containing protein [Turicibacter sp.]